MFVYPRLDATVAVELLARQTGCSIEALRRMSDADHPRSTWYPTGPVRVPREKLNSLREDVRETAESFGYPIPQRARSMTQFDQAVSVVLLRDMDIVPADAAHEGVWSFLSLVLMPDVAFWRFPNREHREDYERLLGRPRNVYRRLWWRAYALGEGASQRLLEDEAVAIMERPLIGGNPRVARTIAETHLRTVEREPSLSRTELLRQVGRRLRRLAVVLTLTALDDESLRDVVEDTFAAAVTSLKARGT